jgi:8-oxo-dGTP diphosphatase
LLLNFIARIWNGLGAPARQRLAWICNPKFIHGVSGVILDHQGRVLLLKHRFWKDQRWGLPGGHAHRGESIEETLRRELREETGLDVRPVKLLRVSARHLRTEFLLLAECDGEPAVKSHEIMDARFFSRSELPEDLLDTHREAIMNCEEPH